LSHYVSPSVLPPCFGAADTRLIYVKSDVGVCYEYLLGCAMSTCWGVLWVPVGVCYEYLLGCAMSTCWGVLWVPVGETQVTWRSTYVLL